jgi:hypothetical protein
MDTDLFREEALRRWREGGTQGQVLRLGARWTTVAFFLLIAAVAGATACLFLVTVPVAVRGPAAVVGDHRVLALLPAARRDDVARQGSLLWRQGEEHQVLQVERIEAREVGREEGRALAGRIFDGRALPESSVLVWATPARGIPVRGSGAVCLREERRPLIDLFWHGER